MTDVEELDPQTAESSDGAEDEKPRDVSKDEPLLKEIRDDYRYFSDYWREAREQRQIDLKYLCGDPWDEKDRKARADAGRPCINHDELNQYVNQFVNSLRQNKRGIKIEPAGNGATDKTAELRQDLARTVEYRSKGLAAYLGAGQDMAEGSYGFFRLTRRYKVADPKPGDPHAFDQEIVLQPISNPDSVLYDPHCKQLDWSDARKVFIIEPVPRDEFAVLYPWAQKRDFSIDDMRVASDWIHDKQIMVAEYWKVLCKRRTYRHGGRSRSVEVKTVVQYFTNGLEILDEIPQPGIEIPIPVMIGMQRWVDEGSGPKRKLFSLGRLARDPQMTLAYLNSQEMEEAGMSPKVSWLGYKGQFDTDADNFDTCNKIPHSTLQVDIILDNSTGGVLPLPTRVPFTPNFQQYEVAKDSARRAVQAAMGISGLPTAAQRDNEKSGIALEKISTEEAIGSYHYVAGYDRAVERAGRIMDSWASTVHDNEQELGLQKADGTRRIVRVNTELPYPDATGQLQHYQVGDEDHDVTVSTGPSWDSQRAAVSDFLDTLIQNLKTLPVSPAQAAKLLGLAIQMKELGPKGDEMAEIIDPKNPQQGQQQAQQMGQMQQQAQLAHEALQKMQAEIQKLQLEREGKVLDNQARYTIEQMKIEAQVTAAEIQTKAQRLDERLAFVEDLMKQLHGQAHDAGLQAQDQSNTMAQQQQAQDSAAQQQESAQQAQQQQGQPGQGQN